MPKLPRMAVTRVRDATNPIPIVPGTPISRRLRSRAAPSLEDTIKSSVADDYSNSKQCATSTDFDSDSEDFVLKKPKPKPRKITKKPKVKKISSSSIPETDTGESSQSEARVRGKNNNKGPHKYNSEDLDSQSDAHETDKRKPNAKNNLIKCGNGIAGTLETEIGQRLPTMNKEKHQIIQSSSEEYKTPEDIDKKQSKYLCKKDEIPDIVQEFSNGNIKFIAKNSELQQVEMRERKRLLEIRKKMDDYIRNFKMESIMKTLELSKVFGNILMCDVLDQLNNPSSFDEVVSSFKEVNIAVDMNKGSLAVISEDSENNLNNSNGSGSDIFKTSDELTPKSKAKYSFPRPDQCVVTPPPGLHQLPVSVFNFGGEPISINKMARLAKPGEVYYSKRGSPIVPPVLNRHKHYVPDSAFNQQIRGPHTVEVADADGEKIKVDLVLRSGAPEKAKFFAEFVTDVRGIAATRSTVNHNRIQPPRVPAKSRKGVSTSTTVSATLKKRH